MTTCYYCAAHIPRNSGYRRSVVVAKRSSVCVGSRKGMSMGSTEALRTLCAPCAKAYDDAHGGSSTRILLSLAAGIIGFLFSFRIDVENAAHSAMFAFFLFGGPGFVTYVLLTAMHRARLGDARREEESEDNGYETAPNHVAVDHAHPLQQPTIRILESTAEFGISLTGLHDVPDTVEGFSRLVDVFDSRYPAARFPSVDDWYEAVMADILRKFLAESDDLLNRIFDKRDPSLPEGLSSDERAKWNRLFALFPPNDNEELADYIERHSHVKEQITVTVGLD